MVGAHLTTIDSLFRPHAFLDESVPGFALNGPAAGLLHQVDGIPGQPGIMDDLGAGVFGQNGFGQEAHQVVALDKIAALVEEEAAVEITVQAIKSSSQTTSSEVSVASAYLTSFRPSSTI
jgi:hypothetical protein